MPFQAQPISNDVITWKQYDEEGCPVCNSGERKGTVLVQGAGLALIVCANCGVAYEINDEKALEKEVT